MNNVASNIFSINDLMQNEARYNIPRYQRLYVWSNEQITTLMEDIYHAFATSRPLFYLGGVLIVNISESPLTYDLIDGQQRFTTLWLLCLTLGEDFKRFLELQDQPRLTFSIRKDVTRYFSAILKNKEFKGKLDEQAEAGSLTRIIYAKTKINSFIEEKFLDDPRALVRFREYVRTQVKMIVSTVPMTTNLNKLFEVINNRGLQLQHHEILKSYLLSKITSDKITRIRYGKIWNACSDMFNYIERNLSKESTNRVVNHYNRFNRQFYNAGIIAIMDSRDAKSAEKSLTTIMDSKLPKDNDYQTPKQIEEHYRTKEDEYENVRSILSFSQLLQHTLRIHNFRLGKKDIIQINEKDLLTSFSTFLKNLEEDEAIAFIKLLFEIRIRFDKHVIKWVTIAPNVEVHMIKSLEVRNKGARSKTWYFHRDKNSGSDPFTLLQSMLYHSQQKTTLHWLTPFLHRMLTIENNEDLQLYLQKLDNVMFCTDDPDELMKRSWKYIGKEVSASVDDIKIEALKNHAGTGFWHYWFYKLEYVLWFTEKDKRPDWKNFRMISKNSIEHVSPQKQKSQDANTVSKACLNTFGNLALVTRNINSEYGHNEFNVKRQQFLNNKNVDKRLDSLKLDLIYATEEWNDDLCNAHNHLMQEMMKTYIERFI